MDGTIFGAVFWVDPDGPINLEFDGFSTRPGVLNTVPREAAPAAGADEAPPGDGSGDVSEADCLIGCDAALTSVDFATPVIARSGLHELTE